MTSQLLNLFHTLIQQNFQWFPATIDTHGY